MLNRLEISGMQCLLRDIQLNAFNSSSLTNLDMKSNNIIFCNIVCRNSSAINLFDHCTNLTTLDMSQNNIVRLDESVISRMFLPLNNLRTLYMVGTKLLKISDVFSINLLK